MIKRFCDKCDQTMDTDSFHSMGIVEVAIQGVDVGGKPYYRPNDSKTEDFELCKNCREEIIDFIKTREEIAASEVLDVFSKDYLEGGLTVAPFRNTDQFEKVLDIELGCLREALMCDYREKKMRSLDSQ